MSDHQPGSPARLGDLTPPARRPVRPEAPPRRAEAMARPHGRSAPRRGGGRWSRRRCRWTWIKICIFAGVNTSPPLLSKADPRLWSLGLARFVSGRELGYHLGTTSEACVPTRARRALMRANTCWEVQEGSRGPVSSPSAQILGDTGRYWAILEAPGGRQTPRQPSPAGQRTTIGPLQAHLTHRVQDKSPQAQPLLSARRTGLGGLLTAQ